MSRGNNNTGSNVVNQLGGTVKFFSDAGVTVGGAGNLDLDYGGTSSTNTYNLNGGTLSVPQIAASATTGGICSISMAARSNPLATMRPLCRA